MMYNENFKFYKLKRPKEGYNSEKERNMNSWSGVSDWELFYKDKYIGTIYYVGTSLVEWAGYVELDNAERIKAFRQIQEEKFLNNYVLIIMKD